MSRQTKVVNSCFQAYHPANTNSFRIMPVLKLNLSCNYQNYRSK